MDHDVALEWFSSVLQRVRIAVEFVDGLHPLFVLFLAWFLHAHTRPVYPSQRYATLASHLACLALFLYLAVHHVAQDMDDVWTVATYFGRVVLVFQIVLALLTLFQAELLTPVDTVHRFARFFARIPPRLLQFVNWAWHLIPPPQPPPSPPPPSRSQERQQALEHFRELYRHKLNLARGTHLPKTEQRAIREQARRRYLEQLGSLFDE
jgi:hypothetical protein